MPRSTFPRRPDWSDLPTFETMGARHRGKGRAPRPKSTTAPALVAATFGGES